MEREELKSFPVICGFKWCCILHTCILQAIARSWEWTPGSQSTTCHPLCSSKETTSVFSCEKGYKRAVLQFTFNSFQHNWLGYLLLAVWFVCIEFALRLRSCIPHQFSSIPMNSYLPRLLDRVQLDAFVRRRMTWWRFVRLCAQALSLERLLLHHKATEQVREYSKSSSKIKHTT
jgi:hypothetical protein